MAKYLYLDGACGISGDMTVAALLDLCASREKMDRALKSLKHDGFDYTVSRKSSYSISGCDFDVRLHCQTPMREEAYTVDVHQHCHIDEHNSRHKAVHNHMHAHDQHEHTHDSHHTHDHHEHAHDSHHAHDHHEHTHEHRHLADVVEIITHADMTEKAKMLALKVFQIVAEAEAKAHGVAVENVHFHEVGAWDSIADIVAASVLIDDLNIDKCIVTGLSEGQGTVMCQHGVLPVPVPAVLNIAEKYQIPLRQTSVDGEMVTPTGIALAAAFRTDDALPKQYKILKTGIGLGKRDFGRANFLRALILEDDSAENQLYVFETNIDDSTPEELGFALDKLFEAGAYDVHFEPCYMKKNRPAYMVRGIIEQALLEKAVETLLRHTSTIGVRYYPVERTCMRRSHITVSVAGEKIDVKKSEYKNIVKYKPEYESVKKAALKLNADFKELFERAKEEVKKEGI